MREIKFRVWDTFYEEMLYCNDKHDLVIGLDGKILSPILTMKGKPTGSLYDYKDNFILMQCTGLKDKNGKEIYEEDILRDVYLSPNIKHIKNPIIVKWDMWRLFDDLQSEVNTYEVVGNLYENPELLKEK